MKNKIIIIIVLVLAIAMISVLANFVFYDRYKKPEGAEIEIINNEFEVYGEGKNLYGIIGDNNLEILTKDEPLDLETVGEHTKTIEYKYKGFRKYLYDVKYTVIDTVKPIFIKDPASSVSFYVDEANEENIQKLESKISYADNYDISPRLIVEGEVDFATLGDYVLTYTIKDSSGNEESKNMKVTIKERPVDTGKKPEAEEPEDKDEEEEDKNTFAKQIENYKTDGTMVGIDVSKWQGEIDFEKVKEAGAEFVIMRFGVMKDKDSELVKDNTFDTNYANAKKAGLKVGIYVYSEANNEKTAISNAKFIIDELKGDKLDFPVVFDWESWTYFNSMEMNLHMLNKMYDAFSKTMEDAGYETMLYGSEYYLNNVWMDLKDYTIWIAKYSTKEPSVENGNKILLWQNSNTGKIDGIDGEVDLDIYYAN